jgi:aspartyl protease family protein
VPSIDYAHLTYLTLLTAVLIGSVLMSRIGLWKTLRQLATWFLIIAGVAFAAALWSDIRKNSAPAKKLLLQDGAILIPKQADGHFHVTLNVNGIEIPFLIDTGATTVILSQKDAQKLGFDPNKLAFWDSANTANGEVKLAPVRLATVALERHVDRNIAAYVNAGKLPVSLLGMSYLSKFSRLEITREHISIWR